MSEFPYVQNGMQKNEQNPMETSPEMRGIILRGGAVHNLQCVDLDLPYRQLIAFCGVSGSGKSSLAMDTLYAEGQRRYIESFSAQIRLGLQRLEKPEADRIEGIPPAIAVTSMATSGDNNGMPANRATVGTATELYDYLRVLFARVGRMWCSCGREIRRDSPQTVVQWMNEHLDAGTRCMIAFRWNSRLCGDDDRDDNGGEDGKTSYDVDVSSDDSLTSDMEELAVEGDSPLSSLSLRVPSSEELRREAERRVSWCRQNGFVRMIMNGCLYHLGNDAAEASQALSDCLATKSEPYIVVDRVIHEPPASRDSLSPSDSSPSSPSSQTSSSSKRLLESLETAFTQGDSRCYLYIDKMNTLSENASENVTNETTGASSNETFPKVSPSKTCEIDGRLYTLESFSNRWECTRCERVFPELEPQLFNFNSSLGACPECEGFGNKVDLNMNLIVPDTRKTISEGAIAPWTTPAYRVYAKQLMSVATALDIPLDIPWRHLTVHQVNAIRKGDESLGFIGLDTFFASLERRKYQMHIRVFLNRWRSYNTCESCGGTRLRSEALAVYLGDFSDKKTPAEPESRAKNIGDILQMTVDEATAWFTSYRVGDEHLATMVKNTLYQIRSRLNFLQAVGLGYLTLDRTLKTLSSGESRRVSLTSALGSSLVNMLYILDEPSTGLHCQDVDQLVEVLRQLRDRGNTVIVVDHEERILRAVDHIVEVGPGAGERGGNIVFEGTPEAMCHASDSLTGEYLSGKRGLIWSERRRKLEHGSLKLIGACGNNLQGETIEFPLGCLCVVSGPSGSGKSTLVADTLYPAIAKRLHKDSVPLPLPYKDLSEEGELDDVILVDQYPLSRSPRSNPVTYLKIMDEIRAVFAETPEAQSRGYTASHFSFNSEEGRCPTCGGDGRIEIDMQFLADVTMRCGTCGGRRYRREVLDVTWRNRNIDEVLNMTAREAFTFFRGRAKVQTRLKRLIDVGLDYVRLGQPTDTLSGGELQRLKLAAYISTSKRSRCLFIMDEPTSGLHFSDVVQLLDCFDALLAVGHSLVLVEHNLRMIQSADWVIDLGPGAANAGGRVVAAGTPEDIMHNERSVTGRFLRELVARGENNVENDP